MSNVNSNNEPGVSDIFDTKQFLVINYKKYTRYRQAHRITVLPVKLIAYILLWSEIRSTNGEKSATCAWVVQVAQIHNIHHFYKIHTRSSRGRMRWRFYGETKKLMSSQTNKVIQLFLTFAIEVRGGGSLLSIFCTREYHNHYNWSLPTRYCSDWRRFHDVKKV